MNTVRNTYYTVLVYIITIGFYACSNDDTPTTTTVLNPVPEEELFKGELTWIKTFGGSKEDNALSVVQSDDGGYVLFGYTQSIDGDITDKTATDSDYWVLKLTSEGAISWSKTYGGSGDDRGEKIIKTTDGGYALVGYSRSSDGDVSTNEGLQDYWVVKINASGDIQWEKTFGFSGIDRAFSIVQTNDGGYFITGFLDVTASDGEGNDNRTNQKHGVGEFWGIKLDDQGEKQWRRYFGGTNNDRSYGVVQTPDNGYLMIGSSESDDFDISNNKGSYDFWAVKVNAEGTKIWEKSYGGTEIDIGYAIAATEDGKYIIVGDSRSNDIDITQANGNADLWAIQIDDNGNLIWQKSIGGTQFDTGRAIHKTKKGNFIITGNSRSNDIDLTNNNGQSDIWSIIINTNGDISWKSTVGGSAEDFATGCIETINHEIIIVGNSNSNDFDITTNKGEKDVILLKYN